MAELTIKQLVKEDQPEKLISDDLWKSWTKELAETSVRNTKIADVADTLHLEWARTRQDETLSRYLTKSIDEILNTPGFGGKKSRILILCIAWAALNHGLPSSNTVGFRTKPTPEMVGGDSSAPRDGILDS